MRGKITAERVHELASGYLWRLGLVNGMGFILRVHVFTTPGSDPEDDAHENAVAWISVLDGYREAMLYVRDYQLKAKELPRTIAHEIGHLVHWRAFTWLRECVSE